MVIVMSGLLMGGLLIGRNYLRSSELRSIVTQYTSITSAVDAFKSKYTSIPGDMPDAQSYWGVAHATPATCVTTASISTRATCNGDGDGVLEMATAGSNEVFRFWQHLANAGFLIGEYDGITRGSTAYAATTANSPSGKITGSLWFANNWGQQTSATVMFDGLYNNGLEFGSAVVNYDPYGGILRAQEARGIDEKIDDGRPATGKLVLRQSNVSNCTSATLTSDTTATYKASSATLCALIFPQAF